LRQNAQAQAQVGFDRRAAAFDRTAGLTQNRANRSNLDQVIAKSINTLGPMN
jgi:hypothetical protein